MNLVDTNVLSEVRRPSGDTRVKRAFLGLGDDFRISAVVLGEIRSGIAMMQDERRRGELADWYGRLLSSFGHVLLPVTVAVAEVWGDLSAAARRAGRVLDTPGGLIAATALVHDLTLWTRNTRNFAATGAQLFNLWED